MSNKEYRTLFYNSSDTKNGLIVVEKMSDIDPEIGSCREIDGIRWTLYKIE